MRILLLLAVLGTSLLARQQTPAAPATQPAAVNPAAQQTLPTGVRNPTAPSAPNRTPATPPTAPAMSPAEAYQYAMQPLNNARGAPDDLTDADKWALAVGVARAKEQCELRTKDKFEGEDSLAMGKLCIFGQDYEPARQRLIGYLDEQDPKSPEIAYLLLTRAFLGLGSIRDANVEIGTLLNLFPYDASIHLGMDMVIDAAAASDATDDLDVIPRLNQQQLPYILDALAHGGSLSGNGDSVDAAMLVRDALRCADALRRNSKADEAAKIVAQVKTLVAVDPIADTASYPAIQNALTRYGLFLQLTPVRTLHASELPVSGAPVTRVVRLYDTNPAAHRIVRRAGKDTMIRMTDDRTLVLVFSLAGPASSPAIHDVLARLANDHITPGLKVVAVTSYAANTGDDTPNPNVLATLRAFRALLPPTLPVFLIPDSELKPFAIDMWPAAILFDGKGRILWLNTLSGSTGSTRQAVREMESGLPTLPFL